jgi:hypothetical protein
VLRGQKTGFFLDQRENRDRVGALARDLRVLNLFAYTGGFSVAAALGGAARVTTVDLAAPAVAAARRNFELNGIGAGAGAPAADTSSSRATRSTCSPSWRPPRTERRPPRPSTSSSSTRLLRAEQEDGAARDQGVREAERARAGALCRAAAGSRRRAARAHVREADFLAILAEAARRAGATFGRRAARRRARPSDPARLSGRALPQVRAAAGPLRRRSILAPLVREGELRMPRDPVAARRRVAPRRALAAGALLGPLALSAFLSPSARAHERDFTLSRDWHLPYKGENEIESRSFWQPKPNDVFQQFEYEYGITDHFAIEPGLTFKKPNADAFELEEAEVELRFNFLEFGFDKLLPAFNLEYERRIEDDEDDDPDAEEEPKNALELKSIVSWYTERGEDFTVNVNFGKGFGGDEDDWEGEITGGYSRPLDFIPGFVPSPDHPIEVGGEFIQRMIHEHGFGLGPVVSWRASEHFHALATYVFAVNERDENFDELASSSSGSF